MKKILIAILAGLLLIGAASAEVRNGYQHHKPVIGIAKSNADAFAKATSVIDYDLVAASTSQLKVDSFAATSTWQIADAKVDPVAASNSLGFASSEISGNINVEGKDKKEWDFGKRGHGEHDEVCSECVANVAITAVSSASAYNAARGSIFAGGETDTKNVVNTWADDKELGSFSLAKSESEGFAKGIADRTGEATIGDISDLVPVKEPAEEEE